MDQLQVRARVCFLLGCTIVGLVPFPSLAATGKSVLDSVERKIGKEPKYVATPRYALLVLGTNAEAKVWMVEDGDVLYVDRNANGDLTDDGPAIAQSEVRDFGSAEKLMRDCNYKLDAITPAKGPKHSEFCLRRWKYGKEAVEYGLSLTVNGKTPMYAGWFGTFWADAPSKVPLVHFGGPLTPGMLGRKEFVLDSPASLLGIGFINKGSGEGAKTYLSIEALPKDVVPEVQIEWPVAGGASPMKTVVHLTQRCCYWQFYKEDFQIPPGVVEGDALLTISMPSGAMPFELTTNQIKVAVRAKAAKKS
jgi:hypothetical protein